MKLRLKKLATNSPAFKFEALLPLCFPSVALNQYTITDSTPVSLAQILTLKQSSPAQLATPKFKFKVVGLGKRIRMSRFKFGRKSGNVVVWVSGIISTSQYNLTPDPLFSIHSLSASSSRVFPDSTGYLFFRIYELHDFSLDDFQRQMFRSEASPSISFIVDRVNSPATWEVK